MKSEVFSAETEYVYVCIICTVYYMIFMDLPFERQNNLVLCSQNLTQDFVEKLARDTQKVIAQVMFLSSKVGNFHVAEPFLLAIVWAEVRECPHTRGLGRTVVKDTLHQAEGKRRESLEIPCPRHIDNQVEGCSPREWDGGAYFSFYFLKQKEYQTCLYGVGKEHAAGGESVFQRS